MTEKIYIFDTTLRDGEQSLAASLSLKEKLTIAKALERMNVDVIEAGFPVSSPGDFEAVSTLAKEIKNSVICGMARSVKKDIDVCVEALKHAERFRIHTFIATSDIHVQLKLKKSWDEVMEMAISSVKYARNFTDDVEFSCEDAGRTDLTKLYQILEAVIDAGATVVNIPDTVGYNLPNEFAGIVGKIKENVPNIDKAVISVHCHDDLGLSVANSIASIQKGARQIECTMKRIGERAGNCSLEEVAMIIKTRKDSLNFYTDIKAKEIYSTSRLVSQLCNVPVQPNKAIIGPNAFSHSSGIHQDGILKHKNSYEIFTPESIGVPSNELNLTSRSGRNVIRHSLTKLGHSEDSYSLDNIYEKFLELADKKGKVYEYELEALLMLDENDNINGYKIKYLNCSSGTSAIPTATITLARNGQDFSEAATGNGPVEAVYNAIDRISMKLFSIIDYRISSVGPGRSALGQVDIIVEWNDKKFHGVGHSTDIVEASAKAYINVINNLLTHEKVKFKKASKRVTKVVTTQERPDFSNLS